jgi:hypothetical protein
MNLDDLEELEREATPAPWTKCVMGGVAVGELRENTLAFAGGGEGELFEISPECGYFTGQERFSEGSASEQAHRDERLIAALRNCAAELISKARRLEKLETFLKEHGADIYALARTYGDTTEDDERALGEFDKVLLELT